MQGQRGTSSRQQNTSSGAQSDHRGMVARVNEYLSALNTTASGLDAGTPMPPPDQQKHFPSREAGISNEGFVGKAFLHLTNGHWLRIKLRQVLFSNWWRDQESAPQNELDSFGTRHSSRSFECDFCTTHYETYDAVAHCIRAHLDYSPE